MDVNNQEILDTMDDTDLDEFTSSELEDEVGYYYLRLTSDKGDVWTLDTTELDYTSDGFEDDLEDDLEDDTLFSDEEFQLVLTVNTELDLLLDSLLETKDIYTIILRIRKLLNTYGFIFPDFELQTEFLHNIYDIELFDKGQTYCWYLHLETIVESTGIVTVFAGVIPLS